MDESRIPWWLILLLGVGMVCLAIWNSTRWKHEYRRGTGILALAYLAMLVYVIGGPSSATGGSLPGWGPKDFITLGFCGVSITAAAMLLGRPGRLGQTFWFAALSLANAVVGWTTDNRIVAGMLLLIGLISAAMFAKAVRNAARFDPTVLLPAMFSDDEAPWLPWLVCSAGFLVSTLLIGTGYYAAHAETTRATASRRHSAMPTPARLHAVLTNPDQRVPEGLLDLVFGRRADIVVLLAVLAFMVLASTAHSERFQHQMQESIEQGAGISDPNIATYPNITTYSPPGRK